MLRLAMLCWLLTGGVALAQGMSLQELGGGGVARHPDEAREGGCTQIEVTLAGKSILVSYDTGARRALSVFVQLDGEALKVAAAYNEKTDALWFERGNREFSVSRTSPWRPASASEDNEVFLADGELVEFNAQTKKRVARRVALTRGC